MGTFAAVDLGAQSGRVAVGRFDGERLSVTEVHRFPNVPVRTRGTLHWDLLRLYADVLDGLRVAGREAGRLDSVAVDSWGVDFGLVDASGRLLGNPVHYGDARRTTAVDRVLARVPARELYERTGIQLMPINTVFELAAMAADLDPALEAAHTLLLIPDLVHHWLCGARTSELTNATTTQCFDPHAGRWAADLLDRIGVPAGLFPEVVQPGTPLGPLSDEVAADTGLGRAGVVAVATHDTGSAVAAVPFRTSGSAFVSAGTWSLVGVEVDRPVVNDASFAANLTNEGGVGGTFRLLRNVAGLWLLHECRRVWALEGHDYSFDRLVALAQDAPPFRSFIEPNDQAFADQGDMPARIRAFCAHTGQPEPAGPGGVVRCILESLALKHAQTVDLLASVTGSAPAEVHLVGGGARNELLCRWTAAASGLPVLAGPEEATLLGNLLVQVMSAGELRSLREAREVVAASFSPTVYEPRDASSWQEARERFAGATALPVLEVGVVSGVAGVLHGIPAPEDRWDAGSAPRDALAALVYRSNLLGADRALANQGGGNTSAKGTMVDHAGRKQRVLWVKGSGTDLASITAEGFAALRLDEILPLCGRDAMDDASMVDYLRRAGLAPDQPRPSIETLLHAFVAADHVDHTHPDAIIALTSAPEGRRLAGEAFGDEAVWLDYQRPGFDMSKRIAGLLGAHPEARAVLLEKHGLVTWGATPQESYARTIEFVTRAVRALEQAGDGRFGLGGARVAEAGEDDALALLATALPALRGALLADADGIVLEVDRTPGAVAFASSVRAPEVSQIGAPCPDHLINTKHRPLVVDFDPETQGGDELGAAFRSGVEEYGRWYRDYYAANVDEETGRFPIDPVGPRVVLVPGIGLVTSGGDAGKARTARDLYHRAIAVQDAADAVGGFRSLSEPEAFAIEYWPLERYKLAQAPPRGELAGRIALVTGAASGIGRATARLLARRGAHVAVADLNVEGAEEVAAELIEAHGARRALAVGADVTDEAAVEAMVRSAVLAYGGLDILVASAGLATSAPVTETTLADWELNYAVLARGYFLAAREAFRVLIEQGRGGAVVFVGSKNALVAGGNASAYSSAKAASLHLARCLAEEGGPHGIRVNTVNPDAVIQDSGIWSSDWKAERASTYGVAEADLPSFYRGRTKLGVNVYPEDIAEAIAFLAGPRSEKSTGNVINVDGGVTAAYPR